MKLACRKYYDGLCMGGDCERCRYRDDRYGTDEPNNGWLGAGLIMLGLGMGIMMAVVLA